jgi:hypothetical protein
MIELTELFVSEWHYYEPVKSTLQEIRISNTTTLEVMKKRAGIKKGIACRFTFSFVTGSKTILEYVGENSYVIDLEDKIDKKELLRMIDNSYYNFKEKYDLRKFGTVLQNKSLSPLDHTKIDLDAMLPLLQ